MIHAEMTTERFSNGYNGSHITQVTSYTKDVLVGEIPISTYFGDDPKIFYDKYKNVNGTIQIDIDISIDNTNVSILSTQYKYKIDGKALNERKVEFNDIVQIYATIQIPVEYEFKKTGTSERYQLDFNPTPGHKYHIAEDGFQGLIPLNTDEKKYTPVEHESKELLAKMMNIYLIPYRLRYVSTNDKPGAVIKGTYNYNTLHHSENDRIFTPGENEYDVSLIRLGKVALQSQRQLNRDTVLLDTRSRGGGIRKDITKEEIKVTDEASLFNWDIGYFDGEAYQENGIVILRVSNRLLDGVNDAAIREDLFRKAFDKYKAFGVYPIIEFYDEEEELNKNILTNSEFINGYDINYHLDSVSQGSYEIAVKHEGSGDDYILILHGKAIYGIRVPGYKIHDGEKYQLQIKIKRDAKANDHDAAHVYINYEDGTSDTIVSNQVKESTTWEIIKVDLDIKKAVKDLVISINEHSGIVRGDTYVDYIKLLPMGYVNANQEVYEL